MSEVTRSLLQRWGVSFRRGADFDSWGQLVEATDKNQQMTEYVRKGKVSNVMTIFMIHHKGKESVRMCGKE
ncbi:hypothetical protein E5288_WYG011120 [Bos mutus]|uniref:Axin interactor dorsalization-associated protein N-terminal domain-containing protein n=1 Tax=Bos mutus TaxID=72004 RepID=A0A6B0RJV1_9CETA|nr:hypothetical protein [Bos mutus]